MVVLTSKMCKCVSALMVIIMSMMIVPLANAQGQTAVQDETKFIGYEVTETADGLQEHGSYLVNGVLHEYDAFHANNGIVTAQFYVSPSVTRSVEKNIVEKFTIDKNAHTVLLSDGQVISTESAENSISPAMIIGPTQVYGHTDILNWERMTREILMATLLSVAGFGVLGTFAGIAFTIMEYYWGLPRAYYTNDLTIYSYPDGGDAYFAEYVHQMTLYSDSDRTEFISRSDVYTELVPFH